MTFVTLSKITNLSLFDLVSKQPAWPASAIKVSTRKRAISSPPSTTEERLCFLENRYHRGCSS